LIVPNYRTGTPKASCSLTGTMKRKDYLKLREKYLPKKIRVVFILESPPVSGSYFYNPNGEVTEPLFRAMMECVLQIEPSTKHEGLEKFMKSGYILVDATYTPVNYLSNTQRNKVILSSYPLLIKDLRRLFNDRKVKIILVKANVCRLLEKDLLNDGFNVLNKGLMIPSPASGQQNRFCTKIKKLIRTFAVPVVF